MNESERPPVNLSKEVGSKLPDTPVESPKPAIDRTAKAKHTRTRVPVNPINVIGGLAGLVALGGLGVMGVNKAIEAIQPGPDAGIVGPIVPGSEHQLDSSPGRDGADNLAGEAAYQILRDLEDDTPIVDKYEPMAGDIYAPVVYDREAGMIIVRSRATIDGDPARVASKEIVFHVDQTSHFATQEQVNLDDIQNALSNANVTDLAAISVDDGSPFNSETNRDGKFGMYFGVDVLEAHGQSGLDFARRTALGEKPAATDPGVHQLITQGDVRQAEYDLNFFGQQAGVALIQADK